MKLEELTPVHGLDRALFSYYQRAAGEVHGAAAWEEQAQGHEGKEAGWSRRRRCRQRLGQLGRTGAAACAGGRQAETTGGGQLQW